MSRALRHGTLFAALNVLDGTVIGHCMQRHRHEEFIRFLNTVEREVPDGKTRRSRYVGPVLSAES